MAPYPFVPRCGCLRFTRSRRRPRLVSSPPPPPPLPLSLPPRMPPSSLPPLPPLSPPPLPPLSPPPLPPLSPPLLPPSSPPPLPSPPPPLPLSSLPPLLLLPSPPPLSSPLSSPPPQPPLLSPPLPLSSLPLLSPPPPPPPSSLPPLLSLPSLPQSSPSLPSPLPQPLLSSPLPPPPPQSWLVPPPPPLRQPPPPPSQVPCPPPSWLPPPRSPPLPSSQPPPLSSSWPPSSISTSSGPNYEVFLSFRGPDTREKFADYLYTTLKDARIIVFRDDNELDPGENIIDALLQSIKQSKISIPILSQNYASSKYCLMELAQMVECQEAGAQLIVPIFYDVSPADLRYRLEVAFGRHEEHGIDREAINKWKQALRKIAGMKGHDLQNTNKRYGELIGEVVSDILKRLKKNDLCVPGGLVGMEPHVREVMKKLGVIYANEQATQACEKDVRVLGIWGMPGIGKTTLAKVVYNKIHHLFQRCSSLSIIRENGASHNLIMGLQKQLISHLLRKEYTHLGTLDEMTNVIKYSFSEMKILILLDDVHHFDQIKHLARELSWFGPGSRILLTVGNIDVLDGYINVVANEYGVVDKYEVEQMKPHHASQLFCMRAFSGYTCEEEDKHALLAQKIVDIIGGIPLANEVTASYLHKKNIKTWQDTLNSLKNKPEDTVQKVFELSYRSLNEETQEIFLDIACFFIGTDQRVPPYMWRACGFDPRGMMTLCSMSLIKIGENNKLWMHNQLREFGREIVMKENRHEPQNRSRLWNHKEALSTLMNVQQSPSKVKALGLTFDGAPSEPLTRKTLSHLGGLRFLRLDQATIEESWNLLDYLEQLLTQRSDLASVLSKLRWLDWQGCSQISTLLIFHLEDLRILDLSCSSVTGDPRVWEQILQTAKKLEVLNLSSCDKLNAFLLPASTDLQSLALQRLVLERCSTLSQIGSLIGSLRNLVSINLKFCGLVSDLPRELCHMKDLEELLIDGTAIREINFKPASMKKLETLSACQCGSLARIDSICHLTSLVHLGLDGAAIKQLPDSIRSLEKLRTLLLGNCPLTQLPCSIGELKSLEVMDLSSTKIASLPSTIDGLKNLKVLKMKNTHLEKFPKDIKNLEKLEEIDLSQCRNLTGGIDCDIGGLSSLKILRLSSTKVTGLPRTLEFLYDLQQLDLSECDQLRDLQRLPSSLIILRWGSKMMGTVPDLSYLRNLKELYLGDNFNPTDPMQNSSSKPPQIDWLKRLENLEILELCLSRITELPERFSELQLIKLVLHHAKLCDLGELPSSLSVLCLHNCMIQDLQFSTMRGLSELELKRCHFAETVSLGDLTRLQLLKISDCNLQKLGGLQNLPHFKRLTLMDCPLLNGLPDRTNRTFEIDGYNFPEANLVGSHDASTNG